MARVYTRLSGPFTSPEGNLFYPPGDSGTDFPINEVYWLRRVHDVHLEFYSDEEEALADELDRLEDERILKPVAIKASQDANGYLNVPELGGYNFPVVVVNPHGLFATYQGNDKPFSLSFTPDQIDQIKDVVREALADLAPKPAKVSKAKATPTDDLVL